MTFELALGGGLLGLLYLALLLWCIYHVVQSDRSFLSKLLWLIAVFTFPILGPIALLLFGPRASR